MIKKRKLNIAYFGGRILGYKCLKILNQFHKDLNIKIVITNKRDGEQGSDWNPPILPLAEKCKLNQKSIDTLKDLSFISYFRDLKIDILFNAFCNRIIPVEILRVLKIGAINFHYGKLPEYRGRFIVSHIILNGESTTFVTAHFIDRKVDAGDIIFKSAVPVFPGDTAKSLYLRCTDKAEELFKRTLKYLIEGKNLPRRKQTGKSKYFSFKEPNNCEVDFSWPQEKIKRFIRAVTFPPISQPWFKIGKSKYFINISEK